MLRELKETMRMMGQQIENIKKAQQIQNINTKIEIIRGTKEKF